MDFSLYEAPRKPPTPTPVYNVSPKLAPVPDISLFENGASKKVHFFGGHDKENMANNMQTAPNLRGQTFRQIYMANIPDRHLDLSIVEPPKVVDKSPAKSHDFHNIFKKPEALTLALEKYTSNVPEHRESAVEVRENTVEIPQKPTSNEPTISDLYALIKQQNEQIQSLQKQVNSITHRIQQPELNYLPSQSPKMPHKKFSIDLKATSFEVSFRPPKFRKPEATLHEITENCKEDSLRLDESLNVRDSYVSDVPSIQIDMENYDSSSDDDNSLVVGASFYRDLMGQVNNVLKKMHQSDCSKKPMSNELRGQTLTAVKQATVQHLRSMGVNLPPIEECHENDSQTEISFAVKQLLMKYLPDDKLAQINNKAKQKPVKNDRKGAGGEFSFATMQYMKKYNIQAPKKQDKILDVTALKLQPKLL